MKLKSLAVKNYRTLENVNVVFDGYYTAISGQNNAGKTSLLRAIRHTLRDNSSEFYYYRGRSDIFYADDKTKWVGPDEKIVFDYLLEISPQEDLELFKFIEKFTDFELPKEDIKLQLEIVYSPNDVWVCNCSVNGKLLSSYNSKEILQKIRSSTLAFMHDSADSASPIFAARGRQLHELSLSPNELKDVYTELSRVKKKIKKISKNHRAELTELLCHLSEKYEVDLSLPEGFFSGSIPFAVNLRDKSVDVPLSDWGSGTRNKTEIMMSILQANRIKTKSDENKITPIIIIEEPESFLHPSAQAEFGRVLIDLANELKIQIIVTTHSPYMLCQRNLQSNILLSRKVSYGKLLSTDVVEVQDDNWMEPFSNILGLDNIEFSTWKSVLITPRESILLVEGEIDKEYLLHINTLGLPSLTLPENFEIKSYGGRGALKNSILLKFVVDTFKKILISFDLDAKADLKKSMDQIGLIENQDYVSLGVDKAGKQCIEGLLPERIHSKVYSENPDLVMALTSTDKDEHKFAKNSLKVKLLNEFKNDNHLTNEDLKLFIPLFKAVSRLMERK